MIRFELLFSSRYENVFIMCTTNLADSLDGALMDRADVVRRVSLPGIEAILRLYQTIFGELARVRGFFQLKVFLMFNMHTKRIFE